MLILKLLLSLCETRNQVTIKQVKIEFDTMCTLEQSSLLKQECEDECAFSLELRYARVEFTDNPATLIESDFTAALMLMPILRTSLCETRDQGNIKAETSTCTFLTTPVCFG